MREAELVMWSTKNTAKPLCKQNLGTTSSGFVLLIINAIILNNNCRSPSVLYDNDSKMLFAALKVNGWLQLVLIIILFYFRAKAL